MFQPEEVEVTFLTEKESTTTPRSPVDKIFVHPKYNVDNMLGVNDIALIKLRDAIKCDKFANPICLPPPDLQVEEGTISFSVGWGWTDRYGSRKYNFHFHEVFLLRIRNRKSQLVTFLLENSQFSKNI